ncbi:nucleotidyltransferase domain-containing protein [Bacillus sp. AK128]
MIHEILDNQTKLQIEVLGEISTMLETIEIEFWLRGGWAIDFLLGKISRPHNDIDLVTWIDNREQLENQLLRAGFEQIPVKEEFRNRQSDFRKGNVEVTYSYITQTVDGNLIMNGLPEWIWRTDSLISQSIVLHGISAKVLNPKQLLEEKEVYEQIGRPYRQKDAESKKILYSIISELK